MVNGLNIRPSSDMIKCQMIFAMLYGILFKLCGTRYIEITNKTMTTEWGKIIRDLIESGVELELKQNIVDNQVKSFYFIYPKMVA